MKRVASLYLPDWPIERIVLADRAERPKSPHSEGARRDNDAIAQHAEPGRWRAAPPDASFARGAGMESGSIMSRSRIEVPSVEGWRPGARWARAEDVHAGNVTASPLGTPDHPFKPMPPDEGRTPIRHRTLAQGGEHFAGPGRLLVQEPRTVAAPSSSVPPWKGGAGRSARARTAHSEPLFSREETRSAPAPRPLVTSIQTGNKLVIAAAAPAARALGIVPGMAVTQTRAQVPGLDIRLADPAGDRAALLRLAILAARRWCPLVAVSGDDGLFLDITGTAHLFGGETQMARRIVRLLARYGHRAHMAVADTPGAAWALARFAMPSHRCESGGAARVSHSQKRDPRFHGDDENRGEGSIFISPAATQVDALAPLPTAALRLEARAIDLLKRLGVETIGQLAALPRAPLMRRFGGSLVARLDQASGRLQEPLDPVVPPQHIAVVQRFVEPIATADAIEHWLGTLMPRLVTELAQAGLGARAVELVADRIDGVPQRLHIGLARPTRDAGHLLRLTIRRIEEIAPGYGIDALALHVRRADPLVPEAFVERLDADTVPDLAPLVDTLAGRIGTERLWRMAAVESDVPERCATAAPVLDPPARAAPRLKPGDVRLLDRTADLHPWHHRWPRPVRMLRRPELLDHVIAELPDQPPRRFTWRGTPHRVVRADGPERILGEWWKRPSERHSVRDYFRVEDESGQRFWLFRRGDGERGETGDLAWFMHGSFG